LVWENFYFLFISRKKITMSGMGFNNLDNWPAAGTLNNIRLWDMGVTWRDIHQGVDVYDWSRLDSAVDQIQAMGASATYVIGATPQWLAKYPDQCCYAAWLGPGSNSIPYDIDEFNKFVWNLSARYAGRISSYEVWNEPQLADFLYPYEDSEVNALATMTARAYSTIKSNDGGAMVMAASVLPRASSGGMGRASKYLSALQGKGWNVDGFTTHIYPNIDEGADSWGAMLADAKNTISSMGGPGPVWVTETNYNLLGPVIPEENAGALINGTYAAAASQGVNVIMWYGWDTTGTLGGLNINHDTVAWNEIQSHHA
jgi:polysaccharide biosynthesis protein PslG